MELLKESDKEAVRERFSELQSDVKIINFTQTIECTYCSETRSLLEEIAGLSDKISLDVYNFITDEEKVKEFNIDKIPATVIMGEKDYGIRFYGIPSGYEFSSLLGDISMVSSGDSGLTQETKDQLHSLTDPMHLQVYVTPT